MIPFRRLRKKRVVASFEGDLVKVAYVSNTDGRIAVDKLLVFQNNEFDDFLKVSDEREFVVVCMFPTFYQDVLSLPPAKEKYFARVVEATVRKNFIGVQDFVCYHSILEETQQEGRKTKETFVFAVDYEYVSSVIERFDKHKKTVIALYPNVLTVAVQARRLAAFKNETILGVLDTGAGKTLFLLGEGGLRFVRFAQSDGSGIHGADISNINMTVSYFRQTLRVSPSKIVFFNASEPFDGTKLVLPYERLDEIPGIALPSTVVQEQVIPIAAALPNRELARCDLLPPAYESLPIQRKMLGVAIALLLTLTAGMLGNLAFSYHDGLVAKEKIGRLQRQIAQKPTLSKQYEDARKDLQKVAPLVGYFNRVTCPPDLRKAFNALGFLPMEHVITESLDFEVREDRLAVGVKGYIQADSFSDMDARYRLLVQKFKAIQGGKITAERIDPKNMAFSIEAEWKT